MATAASPEPPPQSPGPHDADSDQEDDPGHLLNMWLGELNTLKRGLDLNPLPCSNASTSHPPVVRRRQQLADAQHQQQQQQYRCSLINLEECTQDDELDAILGELSVLESQFEEELSVSAAAKPSSAAVVASSPSDNTTSPVVKQSASSPSSSSTSSSGAPPAAGTPSSSASKSASRQIRTESPDNDSAFCDNLSVLSSCSASSSSVRTQESKSSSSGVSSGTPAADTPTSASAQQDQEARIKAEKIRLAIEKIKEANVKKLFVKVFTADGSAKSLLIDEKMSVGHVSRILAEKNHVRMDPKWALVELVPALYMERVYEDHENLVENCLLWNVDSKNTLWFIERPEKFDVFTRPELYLLGSSSSQKGDAMEEHSRQELVEEYFSSSGVGAPEVEGFLWLKAEGKKSWKKFYFVLRSSGLYYAPKGKKTSKDLVCLSTFDVNQVYYGAGWRKKYKSPTEFGFAVKHPQIQAKSAKYIRYLCADSERELHQWVTGIRTAKNGKQLYDNYRAIEEEIAHDDIDILTSKRLSVNSPNVANGNTVGGQMINGGSAFTLSSPARTPSSENKSLDSALSSGFVSDMSNCSNGGASGIINVNGSIVSDCCDSEAGGSSQNTPVNTMDRTTSSNGLLGSMRRSVSRSSKSSSSSGCLSDRSGQTSNTAGGGNIEGFESDFPAGGTIKKRPAVANPRIPLTNTTWGLVRDSNDEKGADAVDCALDDDSDPNAPSVRVGGGGTLLRSAVRHSVRKQGGPPLHLPLESQLSQPLRQPPVMYIGSEAPRQVQVVAEVHHHPELANGYHHNGAPPQTNGHLEDCEEDFIPLPPPPRDESLDRLSTFSNADMDLPPPPPNMPEDHLQSAHYHVSPVHVQQPLGRPPIAKPLPPSLKRVMSNGNAGGHGHGHYSAPSSPSRSISSSSSSSSNGPGARRISFDDNVQLLGEESRQLPVPNKLYYCNSNNNNASPEAEWGQSSAAPPREFLQDLQRVMNKKWQVAEKCRQNVDTSPHAVLGFRDEVPHLVGQGHTYSRNGTVGAWVLQSQQYAHANGFDPRVQQMQPQMQQQPIIQMQLQYNSDLPPPPMPIIARTEPLYAVSKKAQVPMPPNGARPVVLREPTPDRYDPYMYARGADSVANYSTLRFGNGVGAMDATAQLQPPMSVPLAPSPSPSSSSLRSKPPPPPKRSDTTQLSTTAIVS